MAATKDRISQQVVYASRAGVPAATQGEATARLQAILDGYGDAPVWLVIDLDVLIDTLLIWSNTTIETLPGVLVTKKPSVVGDLNSGWGIFRNKHWVGGPTAPTDHDIGIIGGHFDGNRRNGGSGNAPGTGPFPEGQLGNNAIANADKEVTSTFQFFGVSRLAIRDVWIHDSPAYGIHFTNVRDMFTENYRKTVQAGDTYGGNDGWHLNGYCSRCSLIHASIESNDDCVALNANDGQDLAVPYATFDPAVVSGPINDIDVTDLVAAGGTPTSFVRFLSADAGAIIDRVTIRGCKGNVAFISGGFTFDNIDLPGLGAYRRILIDDVQAEPPANGYMVVVRKGAVERLIVRGVQSQVPSTGAIVSILTAESSIGTLILDQCLTDGTANHVYVPQGTITNLYYGVNKLLNGSTDVVAAAPGTITTITRVGSGSAGPGVPTGGTTGQVLAKSSGADFATTWSTIASGGASTSAANTWTAQQVFETGAAGASPAVFRQTGGTAGTDEVQVSHDGTRGLVQSRDGEIQVLDSNTAGIKVYKSGANIFIDSVGATGFVLGNGVNCQISYWFVSGATGGMGPINPDSYPLNFGNVGLIRAAANVFKVTDGSTGFGDIKTRVTFIRKNTAPADAELVAGELAFWFDPTDGASALKVKARTANGTVATASVTLT